ncbi:MAG TPA: pilus assembly protein TadG-related protein [Jatrophihabitantaceae bacterium]|jgi:Flp pilus assembly protein TadG
MIAALATSRRRVYSLAADRERGSVALYTVAVMMGLVAMAGLVVDGGNGIAARERAADLAQQAARAGADALSPASLHTGTPDQLSASPAAATAAAERVLAADRRVHGIVSVDGNSVTVHVTVHEKTAIMSAVGLNEISGSATSTATALHGTTTAGGD